MQPRYTNQLTQVQWDKSGNPIPIATPSGCQLSSALPHLLLHLIFPTSRKEGLRSSKQIKRNQFLMVGQNDRKENFLKKITLNFVHICWSCYNIQRFIKKKTPRFSYKYFQGRKPTFTDFQIISKRSSCSLTKSPFEFLS